MTPTPDTRAAEALRRLHAAGRVRSPWLAGMLATDGYRYAARGCWCSATADLVTDAPGRERPDTTDPLTVAGLVLLAREALGQPGLVVTPYRRLELGLGWSAWHLIDDGTVRVHEVAAGPTEAEAAVAALEAAAEVTP